MTSLKGKMANYSQALVLPSLHTFNERAWYPNDNKQSMYQRIHTSNHCDFPHVGSPEAPL